MKKSKGMKRTEDSSQRPLGQYQMHIQIVGVPDAEEKKRV